MGYPWVRQNESKEEQNWEINRNLFVVNPAKKFVFPKWLQVNLVYVTHIKLVHT
jgi:hypothetical protein